MRFSLPQGHFIDHAGKTVFFQLNRLPGVSAYLLGYYPIENAHFIDNVSLKSWAFVLLFQSRSFCKNCVKRLPEGSVLIRKCKPFCFSQRN